MDTLIQGAGALGQGPHNRIAVIQPNLILVDLAICHHKGKGPGITLLCKPGLHMTATHGSLIRAQLSARRWNREDCGQVGARSGPGGEDLSIKTQSSLLNLTLLRFMLLKSRIIGIGLVS